MKSINIKGWLVTDEDEVVTDLLLWQPQHRKRSPREDVHRSTAG